jgi:hypothetical protein
MFRGVNARIVLRTAVAAVLAALAALGTALTDNSISYAEIVAVATAFFGAIALWLGIGATTPTEPFLNSDRVVEVPASQIEPT